jgi:replicative DNA helicase
MTTAPATDPTPQTVRTERVPPQDLDAEMALLGSMMMSREAIGEVLPIVGPSDSPWFYLPAHQKLFEVLVDIYDDPGKAIDLIVVSDELRRRDLLDFVGGHDYMVQLAESFAEWANAEHYAKIVRDKGMLRDVIRCAGEIADNAYSSVDETREILDQAEQKIFAVTERRVTGETVAIREAVARLAEQLHLKDEAALTGLPTGFPLLDDKTGGGFQPGDLIIVAGRPSMGKTALGLAMAKHAALVERKPVVFFSMEMSGEQVAQRLACSHAGVESQKLRLRWQEPLSDEEIKRLLNTCSEFEKVPLFVDDSPGMTAMELRSKARRLKQRHDIQAVFVDYLQLMYVPKAENRQVEISTISRGLKSLGRELKIPVIAMAQLNRMPEGRKDHRPLMSDLRESGAIEQDADVVLLIHREEYYDQENEAVRGRAELNIAKQRNGPVGKIDLQFNMKITRFAPLAMGEEPPPSDVLQQDDSVPF